MRESFLERLAYTKKIKCIYIFGVVLDKLAGVCINIHARADRIYESK